MQAIARSATITLSASLIAILAACPGTMQPGTTNNAILGLTNESNQGALSSDGSSSVSFTIRAFASDGSADDSPIEVTTTDGILASTQGTVDAEQRRVTLTPTNGVASFTFQCTPFSEGSVTISADNNVANPVSSTISCVPPEGTVTALIDISACTGATALQASPGNYCYVQGEVSLSVAGNTVLQGGAQVNIAVSEVRNVVLPDGTPSEDPATDGRRDVLSADGDTSNRRQTINLTSGSGDDNLGEFGFFVHATEVTNLQQTMTFSLSGTAQGGALEIEETTFTVSIVEFDNQSSVGIIASKTQAIGGETIDLDITVDGVNGLPAPSATVEIQVNDEETEINGMVLASGERAPVTITNGAGTATLLTPTLDVDNGELERVLTVTVYYTPIANGAATTASETITVNPAGTLLLNALASESLIRSDDNETTTITATIEKDGAPASFPITFEVAEQDGERIGIGVRPNTVPPGSSDIPLLAEDVATDPATGTASVTVSTQNNRVRGLARVIVRVIDTDETPNVEYEAEVELEVDRAPILQSVVFEAAAPQVIGVLGGSQASSSNVSFKVLDDLNEPMENVSVSFSVPASADPDASVVGNDLTGADGIAATVLSAGTRASSIVVIASATFNGVTVSVPSDPIAVVGGLVNWGTSYILCSESEVVQAGAFTATCAMTLADRFTNAAPDVSVQFRAEGGNITPNVVGGEPATFVTGEPGPGQISMTGWSYAVAIPNNEFELSDPAEYAGCFDGSSATGCDMLKLCLEDVGDDATYCPLPVFERDNGAGGSQLVNCWDDTPPEVMALLGYETGGCTVDDDGATATITCPNGSWSFRSLQLGGPTQPQYGNSPSIQALVELYKDHIHDCGYKYTCWSDNRAGLQVTASDDCAAPAGCLDFAPVPGNPTSPITPCPNDSLLTITASVRGEEGFVDANGNGIFDFTDTNGNGQHDRGEASEAFVDLPETFLDKNDNCFYDELDGSLRLEADDEFRMSDQFSDEDNSGDFGYASAMDPTGPRERTNGVWDRDKELFFSARLVQLTTESPIVVIGEACPSPGQAFTCSDGSSAACIEFTNPLAAGGGGIAPGCFSDYLVANELITQVPGTFAGERSQATYQFAFIDSNGACWNEGGTATYGASATGALSSDDTSGTVEALCAATPDSAGRGIQNPRRPFCEEYPVMGTALASTTVSVDCTGQTEDHVKTSYLELTHDGLTAPKKYGITTVCPVCGDGFVTGDEACDPQGPALTPPLVCEDCAIVDPGAGG
jgi:hypothetical protein